MGRGGNNLDHLAEPQVCLLGNLRIWLTSETQYENGRDFVSNLRNPCCGTHIPRATASRQLRPVSRTTYPSSQSSAGAQAVRECTRQGKPHCLTGRASEPLYSVDAAIFPRSQSRNSSRREGKKHRHCSIIVRPVRLNRRRCGIGKRLFQRHERLGLRCSRTNRIVDPGSIVQIVNVIACLRHYILRISPWIELSSEKLRTGSSISSCSSILQ